MTLYMTWFRRLVIITFIYFLWLVGLTTTAQGQVVVVQRTWSVPRVTTQPIYCQSTYCQSTSYYPRYSVPVVYYSQPGVVYYQPTTYYSVPYSQPVSVYSVPVQQGYYTPGPAVTEQSVPTYQASYQTPMYQQSYQTPSYQPSYSTPARSSAPC